MWWVGFMASRWEWGLPLFSKELLEQAARRRTYIIRICFVVLLFFLAVTTMESLLRNATALTALGQGTLVLKSLVDFEFRGIYFFLPAMACGVLTVEKERNTLPLLFLTRLGPWTIIVEKLLSRMLPMLMFMCCGLPVIAFTYAMGGLTIPQLLIATYFLMLTLFQVACITVMCSAYAHSTGAALVQTYAAIFIIGLIPTIVTLFIPHDTRYFLLDWTLWVMDRLIQRASSNQNPNLMWQYGINADVFGLLFSPGAIYAMLTNRSPWSTPLPWQFSVAMGIPSVFSGLGCLGVARWALYRRANVTFSNPLLSLFRFIDKFFFWLHNRVKFDVKLVNESNSLPDDEPIAWREVSKRSLGQFRYLVRIMVPMLFPVIFVGMFIAFSTANDWGGGRGATGGLTPMVFFLAMVDLGLIAIMAANTVPLERTRQTWDVLRSMPLNGRELLEQKLRGVRRLQWVCSVPVLSAICLQAWWRYQLKTVGLSHSGPGAVFPDSNFLWWEYALGAAVCFLIYTEITKWVGLWCGLVFRSSIRAVLFVVPCALAYCFLPAMVALMLSQGVNSSINAFMNYESGVGIDLRWVSMLIPYTFQQVNEVGDMRQICPIPLLPALPQILFQGLLLYVARRHILKYAEWYLGRIGPSPRKQSNEPPTNADLPDRDTSVKELVPVAGAAS